MIAGLAFLSAVGFVAAILNLFRAKPEKQRQAKKLVMFFGYSACFYLLVPVLLPVGGGV